MLSLPEDVIVYMSQYFNVDYIYDDDSDEDQTLVNDHGVGDYYPLRNLYATCKNFNWLEKYEFVTMDSGEFHWDIVTKLINGQYHGMTYNLCYTGLIGVSSYEYNKEINTNIHSCSPGGHFRIINNKYVPLCNRAWDYMECPENCTTCVYFDNVEKIVYKKDPLIKKIHNCGHGHVVIRERQPIIVLDQQINDDN